MFRMTTLLCTLAAIGTATAGASPRRIVCELESLPMPQRQPAAERLLADHPVNPVRLPGTDSFLMLYAGPGRDLQLVGDFTDWQPRIPLTHIQGTNLWYHELEFPGDVRVDYKFVRDGTWLLDPRNPLTCMSGFGPNSELRGAAYREPPFAGAPDGAGTCRLDTLRIQTPQLGGARTGVVVVPPGGDRPDRRYLLVHDGLEYVSIARLAQAMTWLAAEAPDVRLPICVCIPPGRRTKEYATTLQNEFGAFVVDTLIPLIEERYGERGRWGTMGPSYGGRICLHLAHTYPDHFDRVAAMSPSVSTREHQGIAGLDPATLKFYVNWGRYDIQRLIPGCEGFVKMLDNKGFEHLVDVRPQGHSWGFWRDALIPALTYLYSETE